MACLQLLICMTVLLQVDICLSTERVDCISVCMTGIGGAGGFLNASCAELVAADQCFRDNPSLCLSSNPFSAESLTLSLLQNAIIIDNCRPTTRPPVTTPTPSTNQCPFMPAQMPASVTSAVISPLGGVSEECREDDSDSQKQLQHCSLFLDGYLRPFPAYRDGLQACRLPGSWILFRHEKLLVEVEGIRNLAGQHVTLSKVNVTIFPDACNGQRKHSYVVESFLSLPTSFSGDSTPHVNANSSLQLHVSDDGTVASILMVYSNFTIVLRKVDFMLSVTLQVPGSASYFSEGLCSGCPRQQVADFEADKQSLQSCPRYNNVTLSCFLVSTLFSPSLISVTDSSYFDACILALARALTGNAATFFDSVATDAITLSDDGIFPARPSPSPPPPSTSRPSTPPPSTSPPAPYVPSTTGSHYTRVVDRSTTSSNHHLPGPDTVSTGSKVADNSPVKDFPRAGARDISSRVWLTVLLLVLAAMVHHALS